MNRNKDSGCSMCIYLSGQNEFYNCSYGKRHTGYDYSSCINAKECHNAIVNLLLQPIL